jgi:hypothetical protein
LTDFAGKNFFAAFLHLLPRNWVCERGDKTDRRRKENSLRIFLGGLVMPRLGKELLPGINQIFY